MAFMGTQSLAQTNNLVSVPRLSLPTKTDKRFIVRAAARSEEETQGVKASPRLRALVAGVASVSLVLGPAAFSQADELEDALAKCKTDFCRERVEKRFGVESDLFSSPAAPEVSTGLSAAEKREAAQEAAAARKAAAQEAAEAKKQAAEAAAQAKQEAAEQAAERRANPAPPPATPPPAPKYQESYDYKEYKTEEPKQGHSLLGDTFGALFPSALVLAAGATLVTGADKELLDGNAEGWLEKVKSAYEAYPKKDVLGGAVALTLGLDIFTQQLPLFNLILPGLYQITGLTAIGYLLYRYIQEKEQPMEDLMTFSKTTLPEKIPSVNVAKEKASAVVSSASELVKKVDLEKVPDQVKDRAVSTWANLDNKPVAIGYGIAALVALYGAEYIVHLPLLSLVLPKTAELAGVVSLIVATDRYAVNKKGDLSQDFNYVKEKFLSSDLPGLK